MLRVGILFGGQSFEHSVSVRSAREVLAAMPRELFEPVLIGIDHEGVWRLQKDFPTSDLVCSGEPIGSLRELIDVAFPVVHGPFCEDGTIQGKLVCEGIPFVGSGVIGSAVCMDKDISKRLLRDAGVSICPFQTFYRGEEVHVEGLAFPLFVKPANFGSSVGISRVEEVGQLKEAVREAFLYDQKIVIEEGIDGAREFEMSVLGNGPFAQSIIAELITDHPFYNFEAKCLDRHGARFVMPAGIDSGMEETMREMADRAMRVLEVSGMARVDFLIDGESVYINEVNTIPGFTQTSLYPRMWEQSGVAFGELIERLIELAMEHRESPKQRFSTPYGTEARGRSPHLTTG